MVRALNLIAPLFLTIILIPVYLIYLKPPPPLPQFDSNAWWGPERLKTKQDTSIRPFNVKFSKLMISELRHSLKEFRRPAPPLEGVAFEYGFNSNHIQDLVTYWFKGYNFTERETFLNQFPQFKTNIQGLDIHFIRVTPEAPADKEVVPLLLLHGWPGSVREFYETLPLLTAVEDGRDFVVEVIAPSLPGFGFSEPAVRPGLGGAEIAVLMNSLMARLGYTKYYVQGGDWGSIIGKYMATLFPENVLGYHTNLGFIQSSAATLLELIGSVYPPLLVDAALSDRIYPLKDRYAFFLEESGYLHIQATKPDTIGVALSDSPAGLIAYFLEKFSLGCVLETTRKDGGWSDCFSKEQLFDNLMYYYTSNSVTTAARLYAENFNKRHYAMKLDEIPTNVPTWALQAPKEITYQPPAVLRLKFKNLLGVSLPEKGGHFFALELPEIFAEDVLQALEQFRKFNRNKKTEL